MDDRNVPPRHSLQNPWEAPFFYEDSSHVFYVTTEKQPVPLPAWDVVGVAAIPEDPGSEIPSLVLEDTKRVKPKPEPDPVTRITPDATARAIIQRFVSEDDYISKAIATTGTIGYGHISIGMRGGLLDETGHQ